MADDFLAHLEARLENLCHDIFSHGLVELWMLLAGITGGSMYFLTENTALEVTLTTNVAFIVCSTPLLTMLLAQLFYRNERATFRLLGGSLLALLGVGLVIFNGNFVLKLSPLGDILSLLAALAWAVYSLVMRQVADRYSTVFITRKVFFYGLLTILPAFLVRPWDFPLASLLDTSVLFHLLFLGVMIPIPYRSSREKKPPTFRSVRSS